MRRMGFLSNAGTLQSAAMPAYPQTSALFDDWARQGRAEGMEAGHQPRALAGLEQVPVALGDAILDLGCGNGWATRWLRAAAGEGGSAVGLDAAPEMITRATEASTGLHGLDFRVGAFGTLPWDDGSFQHAWSFEALYYAPDLDVALAEIHRVVTPGGTLTIGTDFYEEHEESRGWPAMMGIPMELLSADGWQARLEGSGFAIEARFFSDVSLILRGRRT